MTTEIKSKVVKYGLEEDVIALKRQGLSLQAIADELNATDKVPDDDQLDKHVIKRFLDSAPKVTNEIVQASRKRMLSVVNNQLDIVHEVNHLYNQTRQLLDFMVEEALENDKLPSATNYKMMSSELNAFLRLMMDIQKEINTYDNVKKFMEIVIATVKQHAPEALPIILRELKEVQGARWFADQFKK